MYCADWMWFPVLSIFVSVCVCFNVQLCVPCT